MLYFQTQPDPVFLALLHHSLETELQEIVRISKEKDFDAWSAGYAQISQVFTPYTALVTLEQLTAASREPIIYRLTDAHWLLVYECLKNYCAVHNDLLREDQGKGIVIEAHRFHEIDFDQITQLFFWDSDFLFLPETLGVWCEQWEEPGWDREQTMNLTKDMCPLPTQLRLIPVEDPAWQVPVDHESFGPASIP